MKADPFDVTLLWTTYYRYNSEFMTNYIMYFRKMSPSPLNTSVFHFSPQILLFSFINSRKTAKGSSSVHNQKCTRQILKKWHLILFIKKSIKRPYSLQVCKRCAFQGRARANPLHQLMTALITQRSWLMKARWPADPLTQHKAL